MKRRRLLGAGVILALTGAVAWEARTFTVDFPTDPLGPAAFPMVAAALMALGGLAFLLERPTGRAEPLGPGDLRRITLASLSFVVYSLLLAPAGFVVATTLEFAALALLFGGRPVKSLGVGLVFSLLLFVLFVWGLGLPLPLGMLAARGGG